MVRRVNSGALQIPLNYLLVLFQHWALLCGFLLFFPPNREPVHRLAVLASPCLNRTNLVPRSHSVLHLDLGTRLKSNYFSREVMGTFVIFKTRQHCALTSTLSVSTAGRGGRVVYLGVKVVDFSPCKMSLLAIKYHRGYLEILNQLLLPHESVYEEISCVEDGWQAIRSMKVRFFRGASFCEGLVFLCSFGLAKKAF